MVNIILSRCTSVMACNYFFVQMHFGNGMCQNGKSMTSRSEIVTKRFVFLDTAHILGDLKELHSVTA